MDKPANPAYNLDDEQEYFDFSVRGIIYKFKYMTLEETEEFQKVAQDQEKSTQMLYDFITPLDPTTPPFETTFKKMRINEIRNFIKMVKTELAITM